MIFFNQSIKGKFFILTKKYGRDRIKKEKIEFLELFFEHYAEINIVQFRTIF